MSVPPSGDYSPGHVPMVFVEPVASPPPPPHKDKGGLLISRGVLMVLAVLLFGALLAASSIAFLLWQGADTKADEVEKRLTGQLTVLQDENKLLKDDKKALTADRDKYRDDNVQYGAVQSQKVLIERARADIRTLLAARPDITEDKIKVKDWKDDPKWQDASVTLFTDKTAALVAEHKRLANLPRPGGPAADVIEAPINTIRQ